MSLMNFDDKKEGNPQKSGNSRIPAICYRVISDGRICQLLVIFFGVFVAPKPGFGPEISHFLGAPQSEQWKVDGGLSVREIL